MAIISVRLRSIAPLNWRRRLCISTPACQKLALSLDMSCFSSASTTRPWPNSSERLRSIPISSTIDTPEPCCLQANLQERSRCWRQTSALILSNRTCTRQVGRAKPITCSSATGTRCACCANSHRANPTYSCPIFGSRPLTPSWDNLRRPGKRPRKCCGSTPLSQSKAGSVSPSLRTMEISTILLMGCARRDCRRLEYQWHRPSWFAERGSMKSLFSAVAFVATLAGIEASSAQPFPSRPITMIVPFPAGGGTDVVARIVGEHMARTLGQPIVIENVTGAGGTTGSTRAMRANPDGYTILMGNMGTHSTAVALYPTLDYRPDVDFAPIGLILWGPVMMVARKDFPPAGLKELISYLKANAQKLNMAHAGVGSIGFSCGLLFNSIVGVKPTLVPFNGAGPGLNALISGQVDYLCDGGALNSVPHEQSGRIKAYVIDAERRSPLLPNVPTAKEAGMPEFKTSAWTAFVGPRETATSVLDKLAEALDRALDDDQIRKRLVDNATEVPDRADRGQQRLGALVKSEIGRWKQIIGTAAVNAK